MIKELIKAFSLMTVLLLIVGLSSPGLHAQTDRQRRESQAKVREGRRALEEAKDFRAAIQRFDEAIALNSKNAEAHFYKGQAHFYLNEHEAAVNSFGFAIDNKFADPLKIYEFRRASYEAVKQYDKALDDLNKLAAVRPADPQLLLAAADLNQHLGRHKEAADGYMRLIPRAPNAADLYYKVAVARSNIPDIDGQAEAASAAIAGQTQYLADALELLGSARKSQRRIPEAIDAYSRAITARPEKIDTYKRLAELHRTQNDIEAGIKVLELAKRRDAVNGEVYIDLALFYSLAEKSEEAEAAGRSAAQLMPTNPRAFTRLCRALFDAKKFELAISSCNTALRLAKEDDGETLYYLGRAQFELKPPKEAEGKRYYRRALANLETSARLRPDDADVIYMLGNVNAGLENNDAAVASYVKVLELNPKFTRAHFNIGVIRINEKNRTAAMEKYNLLLINDKSLADRLKSYIDQFDQRERQNRK
jgi:tetratricopeptide (TPR) repeat protein